MDANLGIPVGAADAGTQAHPKPNQHNHDSEFCNFLNQLCLCAQGSFEDSLVQTSLASNATYHSNINHTPEVIDHIIITNNIHVEPHTYGLWHGYVSSCTGVDHTPVIAVCRWPCHDASPTWKRRVLPYDRKKIGDSFCDNVFYQQISQAESVPYSYDTTSHLYCFNSQVIRAAMEAYPYDKVRKHQNYITSETFSIILEASKIRKTIFRVWRRLRYSPCAAAFFFWRSAGRRVPWSDVYRWRDPKDYRALAPKGGGLLESYHVRQTQIKNMLKLELAAHIDKIADEIDSKLANGDCKGMYNGVKQVLSIVKHVSPKSLRICDSSGKPAASYVEERKIFQQHFCSVFKGEVTTFRELVERHRVHPAVNNFDNIDPCHLDANIRSADQLLCDCKLNKKKNACGEDLVVPELLRTHAAVLSKRLMPLRLKLVLRIDPPLQWRGGMVSELFKNKGCSSVCNNYRDIMLADVSGKNLSKLLRYRLLPAARKYVVTTQFGAGMNCGDTGIAHVYLRCLVDLAEQRGECVSLLFLDIVAAFASLLRKIVFDVEGGDEQWLIMLRNSGFFDEEISDIYSTVCSSVWSLVEHNTVSVALATCMYQDTWASTEGVEGIIVTKSGCGAGTPLADLMYVVAISKVMHKLRDVLRNNHLINTYVMHNTNEVKELLEVGYIDDSMIPSFGPAQGIVAKSCLTAECAAEVFPAVWHAVEFLARQIRSFGCLARPVRHKGKAYPAGAICQCCPV